MRPFIHNRPLGASTDRTQGMRVGRTARIGACTLAVLLLTLPVLAVWGAPAVARSTAEPSESPPFSPGLPPSDASDILRLTDTDIEALLDTESSVLEEAFRETESILAETAPEEISEEISEEASPSEEIDLYDPSLPVTQELIARRVEASMSDADREARGGTAIRYPYPSGAMAVELYKDGSRVLKGQVADIGGTVYVPVQRFADLFGSFKTVYTQATEQVVITGKNLSVTVKAGDPHITVNERIFYTGKKVLSLGGWIFVPLTSMCRALDAEVTVRSGYYDAFVTSGDPSSVAWADDYYNETDLYWLSRIISAEARGEPFAGQIAVGNVVLNRVRSSEFPNTVKGVIFDKKYGVQFSPVSSGTIYNTPTASAIRAAKICLEGYSLSTRMLYFYNPSIATSSWIGRTRPYIMTIASHKFYG